MPKVGMEPMRRSALVEATIYEIGNAGSLDVTVSQIAKKAGVSSALAHHYFGSKEQIFLAAMRHILTVFGAEVRGAILMAKTPRERLQAIIKASFSEQNFRPEIVSAWLSFYVQAQNSQSAQRLLRVYQKRLISNLIYDLRPLAGSASVELAHSIAALIDGLYIRQALRDEKADGSFCVRLVTKHVDSALETL
ncbi:choline-binding transcriptional repressor BetI [Ahrensia marina]|nr:transcriptional regulator BetI [Ahrensia marina]